MEFSTIHCPTYSTTLFVNKWDIIGLDWISFLHIQHVLQNGGTFSPPPNFLGAEYLGRGNHLTIKSWFSVPYWKLLPARPILKKPLPLNSWRPLVHKSHIECASSSRSQIQYTCLLPLSKWAIDWDFIFKMKTPINHVIYLEVRNVTKLSLALRL